MSSNDDRFRLCNIARLANGHMAFGRVLDVHLRRSASYDQFVQEQAFGRNQIRAGTDGVGGEELG
jgi:hypothetical protein